MQKNILEKVTEKLRSAGEGAGGASGAAAPVTEKVKVQAEVLHLTTVEVNLEAPSASAETSTRLSTGASEPMPARDQSARAP